MEQLKAIVNASYTFNDVVWYCICTAAVMLIAVLAFYEFVLGIEIDQPEHEFDSARRKMMKGKM